MSGGSGKPLQAPKNKQKKYTSFSEDVESDVKGRKLEACAQATSQQAPWQQSHERAGPHGDGSSNDARARN